MKNGTSIAMIVGLVLSLISLVFVIMGLKSAGYDASADLTTIDNPNLSAFNMTMFITFTLIGITILAFFISSIIDIFVNFKSNKKMVLGMVLAILLFIVFYSTSAYEVNGMWESFNKEFGITSGISKLVSAGIKTTFVMTILAAVAIIYSEVANMFK